MARPYFIFVPNKVLESPLVKEYYISQNPLALQYNVVNNCWLYPNRVEHSMVFDQEWFEQKFGTNTENWQVSADEKFNRTYKFVSMFNSNMVFEEMKKYMAEKYDAHLDCVSAGMDRGGLNYYTFCNADSVYFYTVQRHKRTSSSMRKQYGKYYIVNVYKVDAKTLNIFAYQRDFTLNILQKPSGVEIKLISTDGK